MSLDQKSSDLIRSIMSQIPTKSAVPASTVSPASGSDKAPLRDYRTFIDIGILEKLMSTDTDIINYTNSLSSQLGALTSSSSSVTTSSTSSTHHLINNKITPKSCLNNLTSSSSSSLVNGSQQTSSPFKHFLIQDRDSAYLATISPSLKPRLQVIDIKNILDFGPAFEENTGVVVNGKTKETTTTKTPSIQASTTSSPMKSSSSSSSSGSISSVNSSKSRQQSTPNEQEHYLMVLSDGVHYESTCLLLPKLNKLIYENKLRPGCFIRIDHYQLNYMPHNDGNMLIVDELTILGYEFDAGDPTMTSERISEIMEERLGQLKTSANNTKMRKYVEARQKLQAKRSLLSTPPSPLSVPAVVKASVLLNPISSSSPTPTASPTQSSPAPALFSDASLPTTPSSSVTNSKRKRSRQAANKSKSLLKLKTSPPAKATTTTPDTTTTTTNATNPFSTSFSSASPVTTTTPTANSALTSFSKPSPDSIAAAFCRDVQSTFSKYVDTIQEVTRQLTINRLGKKPFELSPDGSNSSNTSSPVSAASEFRPWSLSTSTSYTIRELDKLIRFDQKNADSAVTTVEKENDAPQTPTTPSQSSSSVCMCKLSSPRPSNGSIRPCSSAGCIVLQCCELLGLPTDASKSEIIKSYTKFKLNRVPDGEDGWKSPQPAPAPPPPPPATTPGSPATAFDWKSKFDKDSSSREFKLKLNAYEFLISKVIQIPKPELIAPSPSRPLSSSSSIVTTSAAAAAATTTTTTSKASIATEAKVEPSTSQTGGDANNINNNAAPSRVDIALARHNRSTPNASAANNNNNSNSKNDDDEDDGSKKVEDTADKFRKMDSGDSQMHVKQPSDTSIKSQSSKQAAASPMTTTATASPNPKNPHPNQQSANTSSPASTKSIASSSSSSSSSSVSKARDEQKSSLIQQILRDGTFNEKTLNQVIKTMGDTHSHPTSSSASSSSSEAAKSTGQSEATPTAAGNVKPAVETDDAASSATASPITAAAVAKAKKKKNKKKKKGVKGSPASGLDDSTSFLDEGGDDEAEGGGGEENGCGVCDECLSRSAEPPQIWHEHELKEAINLYLNGLAAVGKSPTMLKLPKLGVEKIEAVAMSVATCKSLKQSQPTTTAAGQFLQLREGLEASGDMRLTAEILLERLKSNEIGAEFYDDDSFNLYFHKHHTKRGKQQQSSNAEPTSSIQAGKRRASTATKETAVVASDNEAATEEELLDDDADERDEMDADEERIYYFEEIDELEENGGESVVGGEEATDASDRAALDLLSSLVKSSWTKKERASPLKPESLRPVERRKAAAAEGQPKRQDSMELAAEPANESSEKSASKKKKKKKKKAATAAAVAQASEPSKADFLVTITSSKPATTTVEAAGKKAKKGQQGKSKGGSKQSDDLENIEELVRELNMENKAVGKKAKKTAAKNNSKQPEPSKSAAAAKSVAGKNGKSAKTATKGASKLDDSKTSNVSNKSAAKSHSSGSESSDEDDEEEESGGGGGDQEENESEQEEEEEEDEELEDIYELVHKRNNAFSHLESAAAVTAALSASGKSKSGAKVSNSSLKALDSFKDSSLNQSSDFNDDLHATTSAVVVTATAGDKDKTVELPVPHSVDEEEIMLKKALELSLKETHMKASSAAAAAASSKAEAAKKTKPAQNHRAQAKQSKLDTIEPFSDDEDAQHKTAGAKVNHNNSNQQQQSKAHQHQQTASQKGRAIVKQNAKPAAAPTPAPPVQQSKQVPTQSTKQAKVAPVPAAKPKSFAAAVAASTSAPKAATERKASLPEALRPTAGVVQQPATLMNPFRDQQRPPGLGAAAITADERVKSADLLHLSNPLLFMKADEGGELLGGSTGKLASLLNGGSSSSLLGNTADAGSMSSLFGSLTAPTSSLLGDLIPNTLLAADSLMSPALQIESLLSHQYDPVSSLLMHGDVKGGSGDDGLFSSLPAQLSFPSVSASSSSLTNVTNTLFSDASSLITPQYGSNSLDLSLEPTADKFVFDIGSIIASAASDDRLLSRPLSQQQQAVSPLNKPIGSGRPLSNSGVFGSFTPVRSASATPDPTGLGFSALDLRIAPPSSSESSSLAHILSMPPPTVSASVAAAAAFNNGMPVSSNSASASSSVSTSSSMTPSPLNTALTTSAAPSQPILKPATTTTTTTTTAQKQTIRVPPQQRVAPQPAQSPQIVQPEQQSLAQLQNLSIEQLRDLIALFSKTSGGDSNAAIIQLLEKCIAQKQHLQQQFPPLSTTPNGQPASTASAAAKTPNENDPLRPASASATAADRPKTTNVWNNPPGSNPLLAKIAFSSTSQNVPPSLLATTTATNKAVSTVPPTTTTTTTPTSNAQAQPLNNAASMFTAQPSYSSANGYYDHFGGSNTAPYEHFPSMNAKSSQHVQQPPPLPPVPQNGNPYGLNPPGLLSPMYAAPASGKMPMPNLMMPPPPLGMTAPMKPPGLMRPSPPPQSLPQSLPGAGLNFYQYQYFPGQTAASSMAFMQQQQQQQQQMASMSGGGGGYSAFVPAFDQRQLANMQTLGGPLNPAAVNHRF